MTTRQMAEAAATYELRGTNLFVNGERLPVSRDAVLHGVCRWQRANGQLVTWTGGVVRIDEALARKILAAERATSVFQLSRVLFRAA